MKNHEKSNLVHQTLAAFFDEFGTDEQAKIMLEILMRGIYDEEALFVLGKTGQEGNQTSNSPQRDESSQRPD